MHASYEKRFVDIKMNALNIVLLTRLFLNTSMNGNRCTIFFIPRFILFMLLTAPFLAFSQPPQQKVFTYIEKYSQEAVHQMAVYRIPASVILAQAIFESSCGTSVLAKRSNNHFGIKCHTAWPGDTITKTDDAENECFRKYGSVFESYTDHSEFLVSRSRYAQLFSLSITDYKSWCRGLKDAGYATYPSYAEELIRIIEQNRLFELDGPEYMPAHTLAGRPVKEAVVSNVKITGFSLKDFSQAGVLWLDVNDVVIQSLDLVMDNNDELEELADK
jgi:hypothetical protein